MAINAVASSTSVSTPAVRPQTQPDQAQQATQAQQAKLAQQVKQAQQAKQAEDAQAKTHAKPQAEAPKPVVNTQGQKIGSRISTTA